MDKNFNDQELSDIMKEIEALEEDYSETPEAQATNQPIEEANSEVMEELAEMDEEKSIPVAQAESVLPMTPKLTATSKAAPSSSMMFKVQGQMNVELQFEIGGKTVMLDVTEEGLTIQMDGGITFTVPVGEAKTIKKVA
jgi:hypothetical protein